MRKLFISVLIFITLLSTLFQTKAQDLGSRGSKSDLSQDSFKLSSATTKPIVISPELNISGRTGLSTISTQIIIQTGESIDGTNPVISLGSGPSINNYGKIAFTALNESDNARTVCLYDNGNYVRKYQTPYYLPGLMIQVNDFDHIAYWAKFHIDQDLNTFIFRLDNNNELPLEIVRGNPWIFRDETTQFNSVTPFLSLNNNDRVLFSGDLREGGTVLASRESGFNDYQMSQQLSGLPSFFPKIADNNRVIVKGGNSDTAPILLFMDETLSSENAINLALYPEFSLMGNKPGLSDDGKIAVFMAGHNIDGAGVYVTTVNNKGEAVQFKLAHLAGTQVNLNHPVAVNKAGSASEFEYLVVYLANDNEGNLTLYSNKINVSNPYEPDFISTSEISKVGETISGLEGRIKNINIYDPVNNLGEIVFWVQTETNRQAIVTVSDTPIAFIDDYPDYAKDDNNDTDTDNYFLRQDKDFKGVDIFYKISEGLPVEDVKINIYPEMGAESMVSIEGEKVGSSYKTGDNLHVKWDIIKEGDDFRDYGFYRLELEVLPAGETIPIKTSIEDANPEMPGWQCPQDGVAIHDLVYKHRPVIYTGKNEKVTPNGPIHPFSPQILPHYRLQEAKTNLKGGLEISSARRYNYFESFTNIDPFEVLKIQPSDPYSTLIIDIRSERLDENTFTESHLFHRGRPDDHPNYLFIHYWMYHPSSYIAYPANFPWHEGDWEMVQLCIQKKDPHRKSNKDSWFLPFAATASQHYYGQTLAWRMTQGGAESNYKEQRYVESTENGMRPKVYIAGNTHACYFRSGTLRTEIQSCGTQVQYKDPSFIGFRLLFPHAQDIISRPLNEVEYKLEVLDFQDGTGIFDWRGKWGGFINYSRKLKSAYPPEGPGFRNSNDERGEPFLIRASPILFHNLCRKHVDKDGNFKEKGDPDLLTELAGNSSEKKSVAFTSLPAKDQNTSYDNGFLWAQQAEEALAILGTSLESDNNDNVLVAGINIYDSKLSGRELSGSENAQSFLAKYDSAGILLWTKQIIGSDDVYGVDIATDQEGAAYITGGFTDTLQIGSNTLVSEGFADIFLLKIDRDGNIIWATQGNGPSDNLAEGIAINDQDEIVIVGSFKNNIRFGDITLSSIGGNDLFMTKYDNDGDLIWAKRAGGSGDDYGLGVAYFNDGNIGITGYFERIALFSGNELISAGKSDMYIATYTGDGDLIWIKQGGSSGNDYGGDIAIDIEGNVNVTGAFVDTASFDAISIISKGEQDMFVAQYSSSGNLNWINSFGGLNNETDFEIETDLNNNIIIACNLSDTVSMGDTVLTSLSSGADYFIIGQFDQQGNFLEVSQISGSGNVMINDISTDNKNNILTTGFFTRDIDFGNISLNSVGYYGDIFAVKIMRSKDLTSSSERVKIFTNKTHIRSKVYPNPFDNSISIDILSQKGHKIIIDMVDIHGRIIEEMYTGSVFANVEHKFELITSTDLIPGFYMLRIQTDDGNLIAMEKIMKR